MADEKAEQADLRLSRTGSGAALAALAVKQKSSGHSEEGIKDLVEEKALLEIVMEGLSDRTGKSRTGARAAAGC